MFPIDSDAAITAILYGDGQDVGAVMARIVDRLLGRGRHVAGFVERPVRRPDRSRCDMLLHDIASGREIPITQDRGPFARGCRLDLSELLRATEVARSALQDGCDLLVVNKFGKTEAEGGGFRELIGHAAARGVPVLVGVPLRNLDAWRAFAGACAREFTLEAADCRDETPVHAHEPVSHARCPPSALCEHMLVPDRPR